MHTDPADTRLVTLGTVDLTRGSTQVRSLLAQPKRLALLAYLTVRSADGAVPRDDVVATFWPDRTEERALSALRQGLHFLRRSLDADVVERPADHLLCVPPGRVWCDAVQFLRLVSDERFEEALSLYRGPFLDGLRLDGSGDAERWLESLRRDLASHALQAAARLSVAAREQGSAALAADWARRVLSLDPLDERGASLLVDAHLAAGDPVAAVRAYEEYADRVGRDLGLDPSPELTERIAQVRAGAAVPAENGGVVEPADPSPVQSSTEAAAEPLPPVPEPPPPVTSSEPVSPPRPAPGRRGHGAVWAAAAGVAAILVAVALLAGGDRTAGGESVAPSGDNRPSVAVLPFVNHSAEPDNAFFVAGVHESVVGTLSAIRALDVSAVRAVREFADSDRPMGEIAGALNVSSLLYGTVQREGDRVRMNLELVDPTSGAQLWAETYDRRVGDVFAVQSEIARSVATSLRAVLSAAEEERMAGRPTDNLVALDHYMRGKGSYSTVTLDGMAAALRSFEQAAAADPTFAAAWAGQADALLQRIQFFGFPLIWADSALALAERAIRINPELPEAYKSLGFVHSVHGREQAALDAMEQAVDLRPGYASALNNAGWSRYALGDLVTAEEQIRHAFRLDPLSAQLRSNVGAIWAALGRVDEAAAWLDDVLDATPDLTPARTWRTLVDVQRARPDEALDRALAYLEDEDPSAPALARAAYMALLANRPEQAVDLAARATTNAPGADLLDLRRIDLVLGTALAVTGRTERARESLRSGIEGVNRRVANGADGWDPPWEWAAAHAALGDVDEAFRHLEAAVDAGFPFASLMRLDPAFDALRADPRYARLLETVESRATEQRAASLTDVAAAGGA